MVEKIPAPSLGERIGFSVGTIIRFLIILAIGLVALWDTMEPYH